MKFKAKKQLSHQEIETSISKELQFYWSLDKNDELRNIDILNYLESKGIKRVVLPREMKKEEIKALDTNMEFEIFAHGALCYSYSGQCLMSSFKGGRSGNRGTCAQPCRQKYKIDGIKKEDYYLSPCDLSLFDKLKDISQMNISCIKI